MTTARKLGLGLGLVVLVGVGAATLSRAQQAGEKAATAAPKRGELRERVIHLRAEVDLIQLEYDVAKARLVEALAKQSQVKTDNPLQPVADMQDFTGSFLNGLKRGMKKGQRLLEDERDLGNHLEAPRGSRQGGSQAAEGLSRRW